MYKERFKSPIPNYPNLFCVSAQEVWVLSPKTGGAGEIEFSRTTDRFPSSNDSH